MKPVAADYLASAERALAKARLVLDIDLADEAGRLAYYAMFHAAQALIFERTNRVAKTHRGVNRQFHLFARDEVGLAPQLPADLSKAYLLKQSTDYESGDEVPVTREEAVVAIAAAERFVTQIRQVLDAPSSS
jgi:uncharacterized protein (UPF0332 family)